MLVHLTQFVDFDQATEEGLTVFAVAVIEQLIDKALPATTTMQAADTPALPIGADEVSVACCPNP